MLGVLKLKFLKGFLVFILIAIIIGGIGYIGYSYLFMGNMNHSSMNGTTANSVTEPQSQQTSDSKTNQNDQSMPGMSGMAGMQDNSSDKQTSQNNSSQQSNNQVSLNQANLVLQNKDKLDKTAALINEALKLMSVDPYAPSESNSGMNMQMQSSDETVQPAQDSTSAAKDSGNKTTINIYPQGNSSSSTMTQNSTMQNMGTTYDSNKMDKLHSGLYKIAIGTALIEQLKNDLTYQAENAAGNYQDTVQYYSNQYNLTVQDKNKVNQIMTYLDEAATLVNINPYVSTNGLVYDKGRMNQIHQSIQKLAEGVVTLNDLSDDLTKQTISLANTVQNNIYTANQQMNNSSMSMPMSSGLFGGLFDSISMASVVNIILILFVIGMVIGVLGFIFSLLKSPIQKVNKNEDELTTNS
jgi:hypothetical protein